MPPPSYVLYGPPPLPIKRALKPGETITLYNPGVAVEPEDRRAKVLGEMWLATPTICVAPGKYKIVFSGMVQSHPKLKTGTVEFEVKEPAKPKDGVSWGKEAGGLQAGIVGPGVVRIGEKARFVVKLRNVSKETIKVSAWPLWTCYPGVDDARGKRVPTTTAPAVDFEILPKALTLKPGETVDVGKSDLLVAEPDEKVTVPDGVVDFCAIHVKPGKYTAGCVGFLKENQKLATATVEFEVKPASVTVWGKEVGGLQAGLGFRPGEQRAYHHGEEAWIVLRLRNVGKAPIEFSHIGAFFVENPPTITDADGKVIQLPKLAAEGLQAPHDTPIAPGKEVVLYEWNCGLQPIGGISKNLFTIHGTGKFTLQCTRIVGPTTGNPNDPNPTLDKLATGKLELEIKSAPPAEKK
jgi:hypothetical protein